MAKTFRIQKQEKVVDKIKHGYIKYCYRAAFSEDNLFSAVSKGHLKKYIQGFLDKQCKLAVSCAFMALFI